MEDSATAELTHEDLFVVRGLNLSFDEAALLCDALNGVTLSLPDGQFPWAMVEYVIFLDRLDRKWLVNAHALMGRLRALGSDPCLALGRAVSSFWEQREVPTPLRLRVAGLIR
jgi:hypothetical protein